MAAFYYEYKVKGLYKVSAQTLGEVCEELERSEAGLTPASLLEASRDPSAPLHDEFEWRDDVAAEKYRLAQAQSMIRNIVVVSSEDAAPQKDRAYVVTPGGKSNYVSVYRALGRDEWREHLLGQAESDLKAFMAKYGRLKELSDVTDPMQAWLASH